jgi:hypothetical protein
MENKEFTGKDYLILYSNCLKKNGFKAIRYNSIRLFSSVYNYVMIKKEIENQDEQVAEEFYKDLELVKNSTVHFDFNIFLKKYKIEDNFIFYEEIFSQLKNQREKEKFISISLKFYEFYINQFFEFLISRDDKIFLESLSCFVPQKEKVVKKDMFFHLLKRLEKIDNNFLYQDLLEKSIIRLCKYFKYGISIKEQSWLEIFLDKKFSIEKKKEIIQKINFKNLQLEDIKNSVWNPKILSSFILRYDVLEIFKNIKIEGGNINFTSNYFNQFFTEINQFLTKKKPMGIESVDSEDIKSKSKSCKFYFEIQEGANYKNIQDLYEYFMIEFGNCYSFEKYKNKETKADLESIYQNYILQKELQPKEYRKIKNKI